MNSIDSDDILAVPGLKKDSTKISIEFTIVQVQDSAGQLAVLVVAIMRDVTKRFEVVRALKKLLEERGVALRFCQEVVICHVHFLQSDIRPDRPVSSWRYCAKRRCSW